MPSGLDGGHVIAMNRPSLYLFGLLFVAIAAFVGCESEESPATTTPNTAIDAEAEAEPDAAEPDAAEPDATAPDAAPDAGGEVPEPLEEDLDMSAEDFECILNWTKVGNYYLTNKLGRLDEAVEVAGSPTGGVFPPGTVIQLVPFEAMVKRKPGWNAATGDWEFFFLEAGTDGSTTIVSRGAEETVNSFGGNCFDCHAKAAPEWDFICGKDHGCDPLPLTDALIQAAQEADPRCP